MRCHMHDRRLITQPPIHKPTERENTIYTTYFILNAFAHNKTHTNKSPAIRTKKTKRRSCAIIPSVFSDRSRCVVVVVFGVAYLVFGRRIERRRRRRRRRGRRRQWFGHGRQWDLAFLDFDESGRHEIERRRRRFIFADDSILVGMLLVLLVVLRLLGFDSGSEMRRKNWEECFN